MLPNRERLAFAYVVHQVSNALTRQLTNSLKHQSVVSYSQFIVITAVNFLEKPNQSDVASFLNQTSASVHRQIDFAVNRRYVTRIDAHGYTRELLLQTTPTGKQLIENMTRTLEDELATILPAGIKLSACTATLQAVNRQLPRRPAFPFDLV